jgi:Na+/H+ antiporter NhaD/arsenite permease-like protein
VSADAWLTLAVVVVTVAILGSERISAPLAVLGAVTFLLVSGVLTTEQALSGFSNPAPIAVAALYVVAAGAEASGVLERVAGWALPSRPPSGTPERAGLLRLLGPTAAASGFLNNTPIVAMAAPRVLLWARQTGRSPPPTSCR